MDFRLRIACHPRVRLRLLLALATAVWVAPAAAGLLDQGRTDDDILPADEALRLEPPLWENGELWLGWDIAPGCYLYRERTRVEILEPADSQVQIHWPAAEAYHDEHFGDVEIYRHRLQIRLQPETVGPMTLIIRFQGCAEDKVCYPPQTRTVSVPAP